MGRLDGVKLHLVDSTDEVENFLRWLGQSRRIMGVDTETTGLSLTKDHIRLVQFGDTRDGWAIPYQDWRGLVKHVFENYDGPTVYQHAKFDAAMLLKDGIPFKWDKVHDTMPMMFLEDSLGPKGLKTGAARYYDPRARVGQDALKAEFAQNKWDWRTVPIDLPAYWGYGALDPVLTAGTAGELWPRTQAFREAYDLEMAVERVLCNMEMRGVRIDTGYCELSLVDLRSKLARLLEQLHPLNPFATGQVVDALQGCGADLTKLTDGGQLAVDADVLRGVIVKHTVNGVTDELGTLAALILDAKHTDKLISAYFENFLYYRDENDILNTHIRQLQAKTGRMSMSEPALQQVPKNSFVRDAFIPRDGNVFILCDYDNQELRVAASLSRDPAMMAAFAANRDLHYETAAKVFGPFDPETPDGIYKRNIGKRGMYSKAYGAGIPKFASTVGLPEQTAAAIFDAIAQVYPGLDYGMMKVTAAVRDRAAEARSEKGYVVLGDGRHIMVRAEKAYVGFNARIQGECAVVMKRALVDLDAAGLGDTLDLTLHDEVMAEVPEADAPEVARIIEQTMLRDDYPVPLTASAKIVGRWGDAYRKHEEAA